MRSSWLSKKVDMFSTSAGMVPSCRRSISSITQCKTCARVGGGVVFIAITF